MPSLLLYVIFSIVTTHSHARRHRLRITAHRNGKKTDVLQWSTVIDVLVKLSEDEDVC